VPTSHLTVLQVLDPPDGTTKFVDQVVSELPDSVRVDYFTWRRAFTTRYDVLHVHWPERLMRDRTALRTLGKQVACALLLVLLRVRRVALVRTEHNLTPHEAGGVVEGWLMSWVRAWTTLVIRLNQATPVDRRHPEVLIPHGDYRTVFGKHPQAATVPGRLLYFGIIREYKGVERLLEVFRALPDPGLTLRLVGKPSTPAWRKVVEDGCAADPRVSALLAFVDDDVLVHEVSEAELVVLPYSEMHNSGVVFVALSLGRPVLAPRSAVNTELADEVGPGWLMQYDGELTPELLVSTLEKVRGQGRTEAPALTGRDWPTVGRRHAETYRRAVALCRRTGGGAGESGREARQADGSPTRAV
jgi:beta-1,4-mannosyltransferase